MSREKATTIPNFITAASPQGLRRLMLMTNKRLGAWHNYQIQFVNGRWFAWYHAGLDNKEEIESLMSDVKETNGAAT